MSRKLPPMKSLIAFESVVRLGTVTKAAKELFVTHGAISKQIASLEEWVGHSLFYKNRKNMQPTEEARDLAIAAKQAFQLISNAVEKVHAIPQAASLTVLTPSTFAMRWLIPRVWGFAEHHEQIDIQVQQTHSLENWQELPFDVAIRTDRETPDHLTSVPFLTDELILAISPAARLVGDLRVPRDLLQSGLLRASTRRGETETWLQAAGLAGGNIKSTLFPHFYLALEAALAGLGPLVCPRETLGDLLAKGDLIEPWPNLRAKGPTYSALYDPHAENAESARAFITWLSQKASPGHASLRAAVLVSQSRGSYVPHQSQQAVLPHRTGS